MAIKPDNTDRKLTLTNLNDADVDDAGQLDVETYLLPNSTGISGNYLKKVWDEAVRLLNSNESLEEQ